MAVDFGLWRIDSKTTKISFGAIDEDYTIQYSDPEMLKRKHSEIDQLLMIGIHGKKMRLPADKTLWPMQEYITKHSEELEMMATRTA